MAMYGDWNRKRHTKTFAKIKRKFGSTQEIAGLEALVR